MKCELAGKTIVFTFDGLQPVTFNAADATAHVERAAMHGFEQKIRDAAAIARKQKDGTVLTVTEQMRRDAVEGMVKHLTTSADWNQKGGGVVRQHPAILAIAAKRGCTYAEAEAWVAEQALAEM